MTPILAWPLGTQMVMLLVLAVPVACITWTFTHEEVFREPREFCAERSRTSRRLYQRKFFFALTCEYCLSHYVAAVVLVATRYRLLLDSWIGYAVAEFCLVWLANTYLALFGRLRLGIKSQRLEIEHEEHTSSRRSVHR